MTSANEPAERRGNLRYYLMGTAAVAVIAVIAAISFAVRSNNLEEQLARREQENAQAVAALTAEREAAREERQSVQGELDRLRATIQDEQRLTGEIDRLSQEIQ